MPNATPCPAPADLQRYLLGEIPDPAALAIDAHLENCAACVQSLDSIPSHDFLLETMQAGGRLRWPRNPLIEGLVQKLDELSRTLLPKRLAAQQETPSQSVTNGETLATAAPVQATSGPESVELTGKPPDDPRDYLAPAQAADEMGRLGGYRVLKVLGQGGMGVVFLAEDMQLKRRIALKVMRPSIAASPEARQRFVKEAQATAALEHEHIIAIHQVSEDRGVPFLAMPLLQGETLEDRLRREKKLPLSEAVRIAREIAEGLAAAHDKGLIHRDIKPVNIWLTQGARVKILDFGLARSLEGDLNLTQTGAIIGTPAYMAPEQARGETVDGRSDLFSLGCVLYRMLTGERPFKGATPMSQLRSLEMDQPPAPNQVNAQVPLALSVVVMHLLAKNPAERLGSARQAAAALQAIENEQASFQTEVAYPAAIPVQAGNKEWSAILKIPAHWKKRLLTWQTAALAAGVLLAMTGLSAGLFALLHGGKKIIDSPAVPPIGPVATLQQQQLKGFQTILRPIDSTPTGIALKSGSLVTAPAKIDGIERWTIETANYGVPPGAIGFLANGQIMDFNWGNHRWFSLKNYDFISTPAAGNYGILSPDDHRWLRIEGQKLAVGLADEEKEPQYIYGFPNGIRTAVWHPEGKLIAVMGADGKLAICDAIAAGKLEGREWLEVYPTYSFIRWSPDGKKLVLYGPISGAPGTCYVIDPDTGKTLQSIPNPEGCSDIQWSPDGSMLAMQGASTVYVWSLNPVKRLLALPGTAFTWRPDSKAVAYAAGKVARIREVNDEKDAQTFSGHQDLIYALLFSPDGKTLITTSINDRTIRFWEAATGNRRGTMIYLTSGRALVLSPSGHYTGSRDVVIDFVYVYRQNGKNFSCKPGEFRKDFNWENDPSRVSLFAK